MDFSDPVAHSTAHRIAAEALDLAKKTPGYRGGVFVGQYVKSQAHAAERDAGRQFAAGASQSGAAAGWLMLGLFGLGGVALLLAVSRK